MAHEESHKQRPWSAIKLRDRLFLGSALLTTAILLVAAWVINDQVVTQARRQVQAEVKTLLPLYDTIWNEKARALATLSQTMADSAIVKTVVGDPRASSDPQTTRELIADFNRGISQRVDLILFYDGGGKLLIAQLDGQPVSEPNELPAARSVAADQRQAQGFALLGSRLFELVLTPVVVQSGSAGQDYTLAVLGAGVELGRETALEIKQRAESDVVFVVGDRLYASSLEPSMESSLFEAIPAKRLEEAAPDSPLEVKLRGDVAFAFARPLNGFQGERVGQLVVLRSLRDAGRLFGQISNLLLILWTVSIAVAFLLSYFIAKRITRPLESLTEGAREFGRGNYDYPIDINAGGEVGQLARSFNQMRSSVKEGQAELIRRERLATIGQMASSIIHDLRSPLAAISTAAEMLGRDRLAPERREALLASQTRASDRMSAMLTELLDFSHGSYRLNLERHSMASLISRVDQELHEAASASRVELKASAPEDLWITLDYDRMCRVLENLCMNSIQAMPDGGAITIRAEARGNRAQIEIADTGPGVPESLRARLFEPFVSDRKRAGTGLGLAIARSIIAAHKGRIWLDQNSSPGARFLIDLPLTSNHDGVGHDGVG
jgi:signal transduction histidine kinase